MRRSPELEILYNEWAKNRVHPLVLRLAELARRKHYYCEDSWYSCPKHPDGCANDGVGPDCNCGADRINAEGDVILSKLAPND